MRREVLTLHQTNFYYARVLPRRLFTVCRPIITALKDADLPD